MCARASGVYVVVSTFVLVFRVSPETIMIFFAGIVLPIVDVNNKRGRKKCIDNTTSMIILNSIYRTNKNS